MSDAHDTPWTPGTVLLVVVSVTCMLPTAATLLLVLGTFFVPVATTALLAAGGVEPSAAGGSGGTLLAFGALGSIVASLPVSVASVVMHPVGAATAGAAYRRGAHRTGLSLVVAHGITFLAGAGVALSWSSYFVGVFAA